MVSVDHSQARHGITACAFARRAEPAEQPRRHLCLLGACKPGLHRRRLRGLPHHLSPFGDRPTHHLSQPGSAAPSSAGSARTICGEEAEGRRDARVAVLRRGVRVRPVRGRLRATAAELHQGRRRGLLAPGVNNNGGMSEKIMQMRKGWREDIGRLASAR